MNDNPHTWMKNPSTYLETKYGTVEAAFTSGTRAWISVASEKGQAYVNDDRPALVYRGGDYIGSASIVLGVAGWSVGDVHLTRRPQWTDAPRTYADAMAAAILDAVATYAASNPDVLDAADVAENERALYSLYPDLVKARATLAELEARYSNLKARRAELTG